MKVALAQLLHCLKESVACRMDQCADADSHFRCGQGLGGVEPKHRVQQL